MPVALSLLMIASIAGAEAPSTLASAVARYDAAQIGGDRKELERLLADDYLLVNSGGDTEDKTHFIADLTAADYKLKPYVVVSPVQRTWSEGAVTGGIARLQGMSGGKPFDVCIRFADTWARRGGRWQVIFTQVAKPKAGPCG